MAAAPPLRVGIMGTAHIAGKVRRAIVAAGHVVAAIASRDACLL
jgi:predicted dehydrogenase